MDLQQLIHEQIEEMRRFNPTRSITRRMVADSLTTTEPYTVTTCPAGTGRLMKPRGCVGPCGCTGMCQELVYMTPLDVADNEYFIQRANILSQQIELYFTAHVDR